MSHIAVILTSEACGHCRHMRGSGRLLSQNEIKKDKKQATIPGGYHYDAIFMKKLITADTNTTNQHFRIINIHYKDFNTNGGINDISIFTLENDNTTIRQTMLKSNSDKTQVTIYMIGESGKVMSNDEIPTKWEDIVKTYVPVNIGNYAMFYPSMVVFEKDAWSKGITARTPIYGFLNGFDTKTESPYGVVTAGSRPNVIEFTKFLNQFITGEKKLLGSPQVNEVVVEKVEEVKTETVPDNYVPKIADSIKREDGKILVPTTGAAKRNFKLYVVEH